MSETPRDLFPPTSERAMQMAEALKTALTTEQRASLEEALRYARGEIESVPEDTLDEPDRSEWPCAPDKPDKPEKSRSDLWLDWDDWSRDS